MPDRLMQAAVGLTLRTCDEGVLVFDEKSGKTSLLNHQGALLMRAVCCESGVKEAALQAALGMDTERDSAVFQVLIASLRDSGLIVG